MKDNVSAWDYFISLPDELLIELALQDWSSLKQLCTALALDLQLSKENKSFKQIS